MKQIFSKILPSSLRGRNDRSNLFGRDCFVALAMTRGVVAAGVICAFSLNASAQTLKEFISTALEKNYQIRILRNEEQIASNSNTLGNAGFLPSLGIDGTGSYSLNNIRQGYSDGSSRTGNNASNFSASAQALVDWTLFDGFYVRAKRKQLGVLEQMGRTNAKFYIEQTVADIATSYNQLIYEQQLLSNYQKSMQISAYRLSIEKKRKEVGSGKGIDYAQALVDYQTDSMRYLAQQNAIQTLKIELNRILNNGLEDELNVTDEEFKIYPLAEKDSLLASIKASNQQLEQQRLAELIAESDLRMAKADRYPTINLFAGYKFTDTYSAVGFFKTNLNYGPTMGASISFNLYNGGKTNVAIKNSRAYAENATLSKEQVNHNLDADVLKFYGQYVSVLERVQLAKSNVAESRKVYDIAEQQLRQGTINGYDFRLTQLTLLESQLSLMQLQYTLKTIEINLIRVAGKAVEMYLQ
ncbi:MAG: hypothetical protein GC178_12680 [Flavobacteriales bacterium]|nr:hypothetical protein [Flavobacteriales bacterium]